MTREEAIERLNIHKSTSVFVDSIAEAIDMAIEALKEQTTPTIPMFKESEKAYKAWTGEEMGGDLISRADAIEAVRKIIPVETEIDSTLLDKAEVIVELSALPSAEYSKPLQTTLNGDLVSRTDAIELFEKYKPRMAVSVYEYGQALKALPSAEAVQGWRVGKPTEQGIYMVTIDSFGYKHIDLFYYGKPLMPNRKVRGKCWYRSDDEWGDVVYDDKDILAWQPLPTPYKGGDTE